MSKKALCISVYAATTFILGGAAIEAGNRIGQLRKENSKLRREASETTRKYMTTYSAKADRDEQISQLEAKVADLSELIDPETNPTIILRARILAVVGDADSPMTRGQLKTRLSAPQRGRADGELEWLIERGYLTDTDGVLAATGKKWHVL